MSNTYFKFKQFIINQNKTAMKVGVDGVLLGAWTNTNNAKSILDIGAGTGLLTLMLAQKSQAKITSIELEKNAYLQAKENVEQSKWNNRIKMVNSSIQEYAKNSFERFDLIICNPPYFSESLRSKNEIRNLARHDNNLSVSDLLKCVQRLLSEKGRFTMIYPFQREGPLYNNAEEYGLYPNEVLEVKGTEQKPSNRVIVEFSFVNIGCNKQSLIVRDSATNDYTKEYKDITKDYYLAF